MTVEEVLAARERFWTHVGKANANGCRLWLASTYPPNHGGGPYPQFVLYTYRNVRGHRFAYVAAGRTRKEIARRLRAIVGKCVRHLTCDVTLCCEPKHLRPGTCLQNSADMVRKGRSLRGTKHYAAKLTRQNVTLLRRMIADGSTCTAVGLALGIHPSRVSRIARGLSYAEVA